MTGYNFHPEAKADLDEIWEYIAAENPNAAGRVIADIRQALDNLVVFPHQETSTNRPDQPPPPFQAGAGLPDCLSDPRIFRSRQNQAPAWSAPQPASKSSPESWQPSR